MIILTRKCSHEWWWRSWERRINKYFPLEPITTQMVPFVPHKWTFCSASPAAFCRSVRLILLVVVVRFQSLVGSDVMWDVVLFSFPVHSSCFLLYFLSPLVHMACIPLWVGWLIRSLPGLCEWANFVSLWLRKKESGKVNPVQTLIASF